MKKTIIKISLCALTFFCFVNFAHADCVSSETATTASYCFLAPISSASSVDTTTGLEVYFNTLVKIFIGLLSVLAVVMTIVGGIQYMLSETASEKGGGKSRILSAIFGLVLALASYMILNTINPKLVNIHIGFPPVSSLQR